MMIRIAITAVFVVAIFGISSATAEIYKYRDAQGVIRYTYDLGEVPEDQRPGIKTYEEETAAAVEAPPPVGPDGEVSAGESENKPADDVSPPVDEQQIEELTQKKKEFDAEFADLMEEKYNLLKEKGKLANSLAGRDTVAVAEYDKKVEALNRKIADYQKRRDEFQKEAEAVKRAVENPGS